MAAKRRKFAAAFTLIEVMLTTLILSIAVIGASGYRYYAALDVRKAGMQGTAARIGLLLCESWRGVKGSETYDPTAHLVSDFAITEYTAFGFESGHEITGSAAVAGFTPLGIYTVSLNDVSYYLVMSWQDVSTGLRALNVVVAWQLWDQKASYATESYTPGKIYKLFELTTYTSN